MLSKWLLVVLLGLQAHFAASYLVPLDAQSQREFGGLLRWVWPWAYGDGGLLGQITPAAGFPITGFFLAVTTAAMLVLAALAAAGIWVPSGWWRPLAVIGSALIPMAFALGTLYVALARPDLFATG